ncbi:MAG: transposase family protein [Acidimicrobiaceae bacterium]|nr:transposase family protein [Acidimicrobiaceae bacterium]
MVLGHHQTRRPHKWNWFHLYVIIDVWSRFAVGWLVAPRESDRLAHDLIAATIQVEGIDREQLTLHADRGSSMTSRTVAQLLAALGVTRSAFPAARLQRQPVPGVTVQDLKNTPRFPERFASLAHARAFVDEFFEHYKPPPSTLRHRPCPRAFANRTMECGFEPRPSFEKSTHPSPWNSSHRSFARRANESWSSSASDDHRPHSTRMARSRCSSPSCSSCRSGTGSSRSCAFGAVPHQRRCQPERSERVRLRGDHRRRSRPALERRGRVPRMGGGSTRPDDARAHSANGAHRGGRQARSRHA